jgi:hypothetical protein
MAESDSEVQSIYISSRINHSALLSLIITPSSILPEKMKDQGIKLKEGAWVRNALHFLLGKGIRERGGAGNDALVVDSRSKVCLCGFTTH